MFEKGPAVLVVDSSVDAQLEVMGLLIGRGYQVTGATSFEEAKLLLATKAPDLLITELRLGAFNGLQLVMCARSRHFIPAIVVTAFHDPVLEVEAQLQHAGYFARPLEPATFLTMVERLLGGFVPAARPMAATSAPDDYLPPAVESGADAVLFTRTGAERELSTTLPPELPSELPPDLPSELSPDLPSSLPSDVPSVVNVASSSVCAPGDIVGSGAVQSKVSDGVGETAAQDTSLSSERTPST
jgi:CheY-like chemotaxis protein